MFLMLLLILNVNIGIGINILFFFFFLKYKCSLLVLFNKILKSFYFLKIYVSIAKLTSIAALAARNIIII
jgi:hypothetical protein